MSDGVVITEERLAKDGWNLADLDSPLFLLGGHRFLLWSPPRWGERRVFQQQREISFIVEHRCFLDHFLAKCSISECPGLEMRTGFWPATLTGNPIFRQPFCGMWVYIYIFISALATHGKDGQSY